MQISANYVAELCNLAFGAILLTRLTTLKLHRVYRIFSISLLVDLTFLTYVLVWSRSPEAAQRYLVVWLGYKTLSWGLSFWIVYSLLDAILSHLPGILRLSQRVLFGAFALALLFGIVSFKPEYNAGGIAGTVGIGVVLDRTVCSVLLIVLLSILGFILWFPVQLSRNLTLFSIGFIFLFASKTALLLIRSYLSHESLRAVSTADIFIAAAGYVFWAFCLTRAGETAPVSIGHAWQPSDRQRLLEQLNTVNASLMRSARR